MCVVRVASCWCEQGCLHHTVVQSSQCSRLSARRPLCDCLPTCTHTHLHTYPPAHMPTCTHAHMPTCTHAHLHTALPAPQVHEIVGRINGQYGTLTYVPIHHLDRQLSFTELCALVRGRAGGRAGGWAEICACIAASVGLHRAALLHACVRGRAKLPCEWTNALSALVRRASGAGVTPSASTAQRKQHTARIQHKCISFPHAAPPPHPFLPPPHPFLPPPHPFLPPPHPFLPPPHPFLPHHRTTPSCHSTPSPTWPSSPPCVTA